MDPSFRLRKIFLEIAASHKKITTRQNIKKQQKIILIKEIEEDLFYLQESAKKMLNKKQIKREAYKKLNEKIKKIKTELTITKKELIDL